jgi:hypothetical protein
MLVFGFSPSPMSTDYVSEARTAERQKRGRALAVSALGPLTVAGGLLWALWQPYRITLLAPRGQGFWNLVVEPPLLVILVGVLFQLVIVPSLLADLEDADR